MPSLLSKLSKLLSDPDQLTLPYNCFEVMHTWNPHCTDAAFELALSTFIQSFKVYTPLYLTGQVLQGKFDFASFQESLTSILRSVSFLSATCYFLLYSICVHRRLVGQFQFAHFTYIPIFFSSYAALLIEKPSRRKALAFYLANLASQTLYKIVVEEGYLKPVPNGGFVLFSGAVATLVYLFECGLLKDPLVKFVFQLMLGTDATKKRNSKPKKVNFSDRLESCESSPKESSPDHVISSLYQKIRFSLLSHRHALCPHKEFGCIEDILYKGMVRPFLIGYSSQLVLRTLPKLLTLKSGTLLWDYLLNPSYLLSRQHTSFGLFLASFVALYRSSRCALRHVTGRDTPYHAALATLMSAPCQFIAPSTSVTLYLVWKCVEACFGIAAKKGFIPYDRALVNVIYSLAAAQLSYACILDPSKLPPSYSRFLNRMTENKLALMNRTILERFGTAASSGYEPHQPVFPVNLAFTSRRFRESVLAWLI